MIKMTKLKKARDVLNKTVALLKYTILSAFGLKWESYLEYEKKNWEKWFTPSLFTWKGRFEAFGYKVNLGEKQALSSDNCLTWESFQQQLGLGHIRGGLIVDIGSGPSGVGYAIKGNKCKVMCLDPLLGAYTRIAFYREMIFDKLKDKFLSTSVAEAIPLKSEVAGYCVLHKCLRPL